MAHHSMGVSDVHLLHFEQITNLGRFMDFKGNSDMPNLKISIFIVILQESLIN